MSQAERPPELIEVLRLPWVGSSRATDAVAHQSPLLVDVLQATIQPLHDPVAGASFDTELHGVRLGVSRSRFLTLRAGCCVQVRTPKMNSPP